MLTGFVQKTRNYLIGTERLVALAILFGLSCGVSGYLYFFQRHFFSYRYFFSSILLMAAASLLAYWLIRYHLKPI